MDGGGREGRQAIAWPIRIGLTVAQVACAVLLVIAAGLLVRSLWMLTRIDPGFTAQGVVTAVVSPTGPSAGRRTAVSPSIGPSRSGCRPRRASGTRRW